MGDDDLLIFFEVGCVEADQLATEANLLCLSRRIGSRSGECVNAGDRRPDVVPEFQDFFLFGEDEMRFDPDFFDEGFADQFAEQEGAEGGTVQNFLSPVRFDRRGALEFEGAPVARSNQKSADETLFRDFESGEESEAKLFWFRGGRHQQFLL